MDNLTKKQRSFCMSRIRSKNTGPEIIVRKILTDLGIKYRLHKTTLPGKPDIVISKQKTVVFINGCFWHQHKNCKKSSIPKTNIKYWKPKLKRNVDKQKKDFKLLRQLGWKKIVVWECQVKNNRFLNKKFEKALHEKKHCF